MMEPGHRTERTSRVMTVRVFCAVLVTATLFVPAAGAKEFGPGDVRLCDARRCVPVTSRVVLPVLRDFYYAGPPLQRARTPRIGAPAFELRFRNGYVTGIAGTRQLDRFLSYGVHLARFSRGVWYRVPARLAAELRRLGTGLEPLRLTRARLARAR